MTANVKSRLVRIIRDPRSEEPDLHTQFEDLLDSVWSAEANWRLDDRIDLSLGKRRDTKRR